MILRRLAIATPTVKIPNGYISIDEASGVIADVGLEPYSGSPDAYEDLSGFIAVPGFIDTHVHGFKGLDLVSEPHPETLLEISGMLVEYGVTSFVPTTVSAPIDVLLNACKAVRIAKELWRRDCGAKILGLHLEGPFISRDMAGAHNIEYIRRPSVSELDSYVEASGNNVIQVTVAPEVEGGLQFISYAVDKGIVASVGHTNASYEIGVKAIEAGATKATHVFNAMRGFHHRDPGIALALIESPNVFLEVIADMVHVHPAVLRFLIRCAGPDRVLLASDSLPVAGMPNGIYDAMGMKVEVKDGIARLVANYALAGSTITMYDAFKNVLGLGVDIADAVKMVNATPAKSINAHRAFGIGEIGKGLKADIVILGEDLKIKRVYVEGRIVYET